MRICLPIQEVSQRKILSVFEEAGSSCDIFEVWLDKVKDLDIQKLVDACPKPLLCVCKAKEEKGDFLESEENRINILIAAAAAGADFIDIGIHTSKDLIQKFKENKNNSKLILSYHNWDNTPKMTSMLTRIDQMIKAEADIVKFVSTAKSKLDNTQIFRLAENLRKKKQKFVVMAMGKEGKMSRAISPLLGGEWMYAPLSTEESSAPGQIAIKDLKNIWTHLQ